MRRFARRLYLAAFFRRHPVHGDRTGTYYMTLATAWGLAGLCLADRPKPRAGRGVAP